MFAYFHQCLRLLIVLLFSSLLLIAQGMVFSVWGKAQEPHPSRCRGVGPISLNDPDFCGCTWGEVYYRGQPVNGLGVALSFQSRSLITVTLRDLSAGITLPTYSLSGNTLGAKKGDLLTVTTTALGENIQRTLRALPDSNREQHVALVIPEQGTWAEWLTGRYTHTLLTVGNTLWAAGEAGVRSIDLTSNATTTHTLPWHNSAVTSLAAGVNGHLWAASAHNLAEFDGAIWHDRAVPFGESIRSMVVEPTTGKLWLGGGDSNGTLAVFSDSWQLVSGIAKPITTLLIDGQSDLWVGTFGAGVYRHDHTNADPTTGWTQYRAEDGLASDEILSASSVGETIWWGTRPYLTATGERGGVSRYDVQRKTWQTYTVTQGLPADPSLAQSSAAIYALTAQNNGLVWAGTANGIYRLSGSFWLPDHHSAERIGELATSGALAFAAQNNGQLLRIDHNSSPGTPPTATITTSTLRFNQEAPFTLLAQAEDHDENAGSILVWEWTSNLDGPVCTTANRCEVLAGQLRTGQHTITLRVQDDEGMWSQSVTLSVMVERRSYLPIVRE